MLADIRLLTFVFSKRAKAGRALGVVVVACVDREEVIVEMCAVVYWVGLSLMSLISNVSYGLVGF